MQHTQQTRSKHTALEPISRKQVHLPPDKRTAPSRTQPPLRITTAQSSREGDYCKTPAQPTETRSGYVLRAGEGLVLQTQHTHHHRSLPRSSSARPRRTWKPGRERPTETERGDATGVNSGERVDKSSCGPAKLVRSSMHCNHGSATTMRQRALHITCARPKRHLFDPFVTEVTEALVGGRHTRQQPCVPTANQDAVKIASKSWKPRRNDSAKGLESEQKRKQDAPIVPCTRRVNFGVRSGVLNRTLRGTHPQRSSKSAQQIEEPGQIVKVHHSLMPRKE